MSLSHLRPLDFGDILDGAFTIYRRHFATLFTTALLPLLPLVLFWAAFGVVVSASPPEDAGTVADLATIGVLPFSLFTTLLVWGALIHQTARAVEGGPVERGEAYRVALRRFLPMLGAGIVLTVLLMLGLLLLVVPGILVMLMFFAVWQAVVIEGKGPIEALHRSRELARGAWLRILGITVIAFLIVMIPSMVVGGIGMAVALFTMVSTQSVEAAADLPVWLVAVNNCLSTALSALTTPFMVAAFTLLYYDRRVRTDGLDLEIATERLAVPS